MWDSCNAGKESEVLDKSLMSAEVERTRYKNEARPVVVAVNASFSRPLPILLLPAAEPVPFGLAGRAHSPTRLNFEVLFRRLFCLKHGLIYLIYLTEENLRISSQSGVAAATMRPHLEVFPLFDPSTLPPTPPYSRTLSIPFET